jgi:hypothetical protein
MVAPRTRNYVNKVIAQVSHWIELFA